jgi:hypothetical protein
LPEAAVLTLLFRFRVAPAAAAREPSLPGADEQLPRFPDAAAAAAAGATIVIAIAAADRNGEI